MNTKDESTIQALQEQLGIPCQYGPWWTARRLLQEVWKKKPQVIRDASTDLRDLPFTDASRDIAWMRDLEPSMIGWTVHHFDKNSQYLSACRGVKNGIGDPVHVADGDDGTHIVPGLPGIYRVTHNRRTMTTFDGCLYPEIIEPGQEWVTNDVLLFAREYAYDLTIHEAWVFEDYTKILDKWAEKLWNGRKALKGKNDKAYREMKIIAVVGNGGWATNKQKHEGTDLIHPNWWADVVGKARVNILANLLKFGAPPVLIEVDGLYFVRSDDNPRTAVPGILDRMNECGGYKHCSSFTLTQEIYEQACGLGVGSLASLFKQAGGER